jgi:hypothetical protein
MSIHGGFLYCNLAIVRPSVLLSQLFLHSPVDMKEFAWHVTLLLAIVPTARLLLEHYTNWQSKLAGKNIWEHKPSFES